MKIPPVLCKVCHSEPMLETINGIDGFKYVLRCPNGHQPLGGFKLCDDEVEAQMEWQAENKPPYKTEFSKLPFCKVCHSPPMSETVCGGIDSTKYVVKCPNGHQPLSGFKLCDTTEEAIQNWKTENEPVPDAKPDSKLMFNAIAAARFFVELAESKGLAYDDATVKERFQALIDTKTIDLFYAAVSFCMAKLQTGELCPPGGKVMVAKPDTSIYVPPGFKRH